ncbi:putative NAD-specific glutamate dehydrogenase [Anaeromyxobacter dehalogenans 2CP-C]|uniref:Putative NAD-specific glutamate dehydrogenase n=1 Tax=Anaeromyxobacter dehalogenans (strain 2CP-C) TaxID=290397 RepID=Q2INJ2_ANADE|nr:putative NAD-specific glutamate dehydrogenase [Anaeromyxobacter dehalogenans 2CP-C]
MGTSAVLRAVILVLALRAGGGRGVAELVHAVAGHGLRHVLVHAALRERLGGRVHRLDPGLHRQVVGALHGGAQAAHPLLDGGPLVGPEQLAVHRERGLERGEDPVALHPPLAQEALGHVLLGVLDALHQHVLDLFLGEAVGGLHLDALLDAGGDLARRDLQDAVRVHGVGDLHPRDAGRHGRDALQREAGQRAAVAGQLALALHHVDHHAGLAVGVGGELLRGRGRDGGVAQDDLLDHPAHHLDAERERDDVEQQHVLAAAPVERVGLDGGAERHHGVRVEVGERLLAEQRLHVPAHQRRPRGPAHQHHPVHLLDAGVAQRRPARDRGALHHRLDERLQLGAGQARPQAVALRQLHLGLDRLPVGERLADLLGGGHGPAQHRRRGVRVRRGEPALEQRARHQPVEVVAAEVRVTDGGQHLEDALLQPQDGHVERAAAQVVHREHALRALVEAVRHRRRGRLVQQPQHVEPGEPARVLGGLALRVVEVRRHGDHAAARRAAQRLAGRAPQHPQDLRRDLDRRDRALAAAHPQADHRAGLVELVDAAVLRPDVARAAAHEALHRQDRVHRPLGGAALGGPADLHAAFGRVEHRRREQRLALVHREDAGAVPLVHVGDERVGRAEVDPDRAGHGFLLLRIGYDATAALARSASAMMWS